MFDYPAAFQYSYAFISLQTVMYPFLRRILFTLNAETAHDLALDSLGAAERLQLLKLWQPKVEEQPVEVMGLSFSNPVGLAAGLDKNGDYFNALGQLGFGFVEIGTITPKPQPGNDKPRMFRLEEHEAIVNRMGFNNKGVDYLVEQVKKRRFDGVLGINIGKNKSTSEDDALKDYQLAMQAVYPYADYITVNISSPNTPGLRDLQFGDNLKKLLAGLKSNQENLHSLHGHYRPVVVKIAPDMDENAIKDVSQTLLDEGMDGVIATNTTLAREAVASHRYANEMGGLSGAPLTHSSTKVIEQLRSHVGDLPIIGVGGIMSGNDAREKIEAGANLVQVYSGFIYEGPALIQSIRKTLLETEL